MTRPTGAQLLVDFDVDERERLNEWAAEVDVGVDELVRRLVLRYVNPPRSRDAIDDRIGQTLLARAAQTGHIPDDASEKLQQAMRDLGLADEGT